MLHLNWALIDTIHSKGNKFVTGVKIMAIANKTYCFISTLQYNTKSTCRVCLRLQIAKANLGGWSYTQSMVKPVIIKVQQY